MAFRLAKTFPAQVGKNTARVKTPDFFGFIHELPCIITKARPVQAAHVSIPNKDVGAPGRGKGKKVSDRWCLPLCQEKHDEQHRMNEKAFWELHQINPHLACLVLWGIYCERGDGAIEVAKALILEGRIGR